MAAARNLLRHGEIAVIAVLDSNPDLVGHPGMAIRSARGK
jgi:hypothetical protein